MIPQYSIYIIDDEQSVRDGIGMALGDEYKIDSFSTAESALLVIKNKKPDLILLDIGLPGMDGLDAIKKIRYISPEILIIMITAYEDINTVISAMKLGAHDYVVKPIHMDTLEITINNALDSISLKKEVKSLQEKFLKENLPCLVGESNTIQDLVEFIEKIAKSPDTPVLIIGETGTGKELIASAIHYRSPNFKGSLVTVNCAVIQNNLIESEIFGYEKGAFSGASISGKKGLIEEASNGTLFLDEVGDLSLEAQAKLLRFLEQGEFYKVGGTKKHTIKTRVVSATNKDLDLMIEKKLFRKDLYFRLGVIKIQVPSLNERIEDIIPIAKHFLFEFSKKFGKSFTSISPQAKSALLKYKWKGNIREIKNIIERGVLIGNGPELTLRNIGMEVADSHTEPDGKEKNKTIFPPLPITGIDLSSVQKNLEKFYLKEALLMTGGNVCKAAELLNINHHTFRYRQKILKID